jgi:hypothetical protein
MIDPMFFLLRAHDNDGYMFPEYHADSFESWVKLDKRKVNLNFTPRRKLDLSYTYDGYLIASSRFVEYCKKNSLIGFEFISLNSSKFYVVKAIETVSLKENNASSFIEYHQFHEMYSEYFEVVCPTSSDFILDFKNDFAITELKFGTGNQKSGEIFVRGSVGEKMKTEKFKGLFLEKC